MQAPPHTPNGPENPAMKVLKLNPRQNRFIPLLYINNI